MPILTSTQHREAALLLRAPYEHPLDTKGITKEDHTIVTRLVSQGLLERNPWNPQIVRCTETGESVRLMITRARSRAA